MLFFRLKTCQIALVIENNDILLQCDLQYGR